MPPYLDPEMSKITSQVVGSVRSAVSLSIGGGIFGSLLVGGLLMYLIGMVRGIQYQVFIFLVHVNLPGLAHKYFSMMTVIAQLDIFFGEDLNKMIFEFPNDKSLDDHFEMFGYESQNFLILTGSLLLPLLFLTVVNYAALKFVNYVGIKGFKWKCCRNMGIWAYSGFFSLKGTLILFFTEGYFDLSMCVILQLQ